MSENLWKHAAVVIALGSASVSLIALAFNYWLSRVTTPSSLLKQFQDYNLAVARDKQVAEILGRTEFRPAQDAEWVQRLHLVFYRLNILYETWQAHKRWLLPRSYILLNFDEIIALMATCDHEQLSYILYNRRGYTKQFKTAVLDRIEEMVKLGYIRTGWPERHGRAKLDPGSASAPTKADADSAPSPS